MLRQRVGSNFGGSGTDATARKRDGAAAASRFRSSGMQAADWPTLNCKESKPRPQEGPNSPGGGGISDRQTGRQTVSSSWSAFEVSFGRLDAAFMLMRSGRGLVFLFPPPLLPRTRPPDQSRSLWANPVLKGQNQIGGSATTWS